MKESFSRPRKIAWAIWVIASIFYAYQYILRVMPSIFLEDVMGQFHMSAACFGQYSGIYYIGYSLMHLPVGIMLDRYGPKKIMSSCILLTVIGLIPLLFAQRQIYPILGRLLIGIGSSAAILGVFKIIRMMFSEERFARMLSFSVTIGLIGAIYGGGPVSYMKEHFGYQTVVQVFAAIGILLAIVTYKIVPNTREKAKRSVFSDMKEVFSNRKILSTCFFAGLMVGPLEGFADVWGSVFLKEVYFFETAIAASLPSFIFIGMCFGSPVLNFVSEKMGSYLGAIIGAGSVMGVSFFLMILFPLSSSLLSLSFILVGVCSAYQILAIYKASTYVREEVAGFTTAFANMIIMIFGYGFHTVIGGTVKALGGFENPKALIYGVSIIPLALIVGTSGFVLLLVREKTRKMSKSEDWMQI